MALNELFSTSERTLILDSVIFLDVAFGVSEIARKSLLSKGLVSKYFEILLRNKVLKKSGNKLIVENNSVVKSLKILLNIQKVKSPMFKKFDFVKAVGLYGSCAKGLNNSNSDIDLWVKFSKASDSQLAGFVSELKKELSNANVLLLDGRKIELLKRNDALFYNSLFFGSIIIYGEENAI